MTLQDLVNKARDAIGASSGKLTDQQLAAWLASVLAQNHTDEWLDFTIKEAAESLLAGGEIPYLATGMAP